MLVLLKSLLWDPAAARAFILVAITGAGVYMAQPTGRPWYERLLTSVPIALGIGGASVAGAPAPPKE